MGVRDDEGGKGRSIEAAAEGCSARVSVYLLGVMSALSYGTVSIEWWGNVRRLRSADGLLHSRRTSQVVVVV